MDEEEIRKLEPKYTGNMRHLTEGEAAAIKNDPANRDDDDEGFLDDVPGLALFGSDEG